MSTWAQSGDGPVVLRAEKLGRSVREKVLVMDASFEVRKGETLAIAGPSGSGKSSLLRLLNRLDEPTSGTVYLDGVDYRKIAPRELRRRVGMVTQRAYLFPGTVAENLRFGPRQRGEELNQSRIEELLAGVGLAGYGSRDVANLSGGEAQRVSFARTLANSPEGLVLDEPTSALDEDSKHGVEALIVQIGHAQGIPCVLVTHDMGQAARLAQRVLILEAGRIVRSGRSRRCCVLKALFHGQLQLGLAQSVVAGLAALVVVLVGRRRGIHLEKELAIAMVRGLVQIVTVGSILLLLLRGPDWTSVFLLVAMIVAAERPRHGARRVCRRRSWFPPGRSRVARVR